MERFPIIPIVIGILCLGCGIWQLCTRREAFNSRWGETHNFGSHYAAVIQLVSILYCSFGLFNLVVLPLLWYFVSPTVSLLVLIAGGCLIIAVRYLIVRKYANDLEDSAHS